MLMRFNISNFMSFNDEQEFCLYSGKVEKFKERILKINDSKVLKFAAVYGANAAGKSNLVKALEAGKIIITEGLKSGRYRKYYFRNDKVNKDKETKFEYEISIGQKKYAYGFCVNLNNEIILSEWLYELRDKNEFVIFERDVTSKRYYFEEEMFKSEENCDTFKFYLNDANRIKDNLLLYEISRRNIEDLDFEIFNNIFGWFEKDLVIIYPDTVLGNSYWRFSDNNKELVKMLQYFDTGITSYQLKKLRVEAFKEFLPDDEIFNKIVALPEKKENIHLVKKKGILRLRENLFEIEIDSNGKIDINKLLFLHGNSLEKFEYGEESDGTRRLIELLEIIMDKKSEKTYVIDELDRSLHPQMTRKFVETFFKLSANNKSQLCITTHESNLLDLNILRRDEVWFAEREADNSTNLYSLERFKTRYDTVVSKAYLTGRYGAIPIFRDFEYSWGR